MDNAEVGARLRELRTAHGLTQARLAEAAGLTTEAVSRIERGGEPKLTTLAQLARALGVDLVDLFKTTKARSKARSKQLEALDEVLSQMEPKLAKALTSGFIATARAVQRRGGG